jgi:hypothetical protein
MKFKLATAAAAVLMSATASQAADLAKKAPVAVDYVKVCDAYGAGFFYIPGSDTCLKIGGFVRAEVFAGSADWGASATSLGDSGSRSDNDFVTRARLLLSADARTQTDFGLLRSYFAVQGTNSTGNQNFYEVDKAYIQWGGLTAGYAAGMWDVFTGFTPQRYFSGDEYDNSRTLLAYTFSLGNGLGATISLEDSTKAGRYGTNYGGNHAPDVVAKLTLAQTWGTAQVMAAAHENYGNDVVDDEKWGYAVGAGVVLNLPMFGAGDQFGVQAAYSKGALVYASANLIPTTWDFNNALDQSEAWGIQAGFRHVFSPTLMANIDASYASVDLAGTNADYSQNYVAGSLTWAPYGGVTGSPSVAISAIVEYRNVDLDVGGSADGLVGGLRIQRNF